jgi:hypothetical protein
VTAVLTSKEEVRFLGVQGNLGIARRIGGLWSVEGGVVRTQFDAPYRGGFSHKYTEIYVGVARDPLSARIYFSPDYLRAGGRTIYGEIDGSVAPFRNWRLTAHAGALAYVSEPDGGFRPYSFRYDWRLGVMRQLGAFELHAALSGGGPGRQYYRGDLHSRTALTVGASWNF